MCSASRLVWLSALTVFPIAACNPVFTPPNEMLVRVAEFSSKTPLEGVEICETETTNCVLTDDNGHATLQLPTEPEFSYTVTKEDYESLLIADIIDPDYDASPTYWLVGDEATTDWMEALDSHYPMMGTGSVTVFVGFEGATFDLVTATGEAFYEEEEERVVTPRLHCDDAPDPCLETTTPWGTGGFVELAPGEFQIEVGGTADGCIAGEAWPGDGVNRIRVPIREGYFTLANFICPPP